MKQLESLIVVVMFFCCLSSQSATNSTGEYRAQQTLNGLMEYYWSHDPENKDIGFFFACGQIGAGYNADWTKCSCLALNPCATCYRWWDGVAMESIATYGILANTKNHSEIASTVFSHSPYNSKWDAGTKFTYIDDFAWYGIAYFKVYEWLKDTIWLNHSLAIYEWAWKYGWDEPCGGFWWSTMPGEQFKDTITIMEMLHFSSKLALTFPNNTDYTSRAVRIWKWIFSFQNGRGMLTEKNLISTGLLPELCCNSSAKDIKKTCYNSKLAGTSYNQGLFLSSAAQLYALTNDSQYLDSGMVVLNAMLENYTTSDGLLLDEKRGDQTFQTGGQCTWSTDPGGDWYSFSGIFMLHLGYFTDILVSKKALPNDKLQAIKQLIGRTSDSAWNKSALWPPFKKGYDVCNSDASNLTSSFPKFHWWWSNRTSAKEEMPPDAGLYFRKTGLRCVGNNTQLWDGRANSQDVCEKKCTQDPRCSKYLFSTSHNHCWTWSYNRTDHICNHTDSDFNIGVKRPIGHASCKSVCNSTGSQKIEEGVCYCDDNCTTHLDCCLDYAEECVKQDIPTCKGLCQSPQAQVINGGGYCWCLDGCNPRFTDNNSMGSCCPDYLEQCFNTTIPACMDARSQGSALNLFLAHAMISTL